MARELPPTTSCREVACEVAVAVVSRGATKRIRPAVIVIEAHQSPAGTRCTTVSTPGGASSGQTGEGHERVGCTRGAACDHRGT
jgi:hypothetical protein